MGIKLFVTLCTIFTLVASSTNSCGVEASKQDVINTMEIGNKIVVNQPTPTDIEFSIERFNVIRRAYWVNGMEEKASQLECPVERPLGYIALIVDGVGILETFVVDGKVSSLNSYLTPDSEYYESQTNFNDWVPDIDGTYGMNDGGIFFFTPDGHYHEWNGKYFYSDTPIHVDNPILQVESGGMK